MDTLTGLSDAETRRDAILEAASAVFARSGYASTPVTDVARAAGISQAYVFKLFPTKCELFVAVVTRCYDRIVAVLSEAADATGSTKSEKILDAMEQAYQRLMIDRELLMVQVHAQAAMDVPEVADAVRRGTGFIIATVKARSRAKKMKIQRFIAHAQLCNLITSLDVLDSEETWAKILTVGFRK